MTGTRSTNRRNALRALVAGGGLTLVGGGVWCRRAYAIEKLRRSLIADCSVDLTQKAHIEQTAIPEKAREEIRRWFHGKCLNIAPFVGEVCSEPFREKLHLCKTEDEQHAMLLVAFNGRVATDVEITNRVRMIAEEVDQELKADWRQCCTSIADRWKLSIRPYAASFNFEEFAARTEAMVREHIAEAIEQARVVNQHPTLGETLGALGETTLQLIRMLRIKVDRTGVDSNPGAYILVFPAFVFLALKNLFQYITGQMSDPRADLQTSISARVSLLGNRVGAEFESEVTSRIAQLHNWQNDAFQRAADHYAEESVGWLS